MSDSPRDSDFCDRVCQRAVKCRVGRLLHYRIVIEGLGDRVFCGAETPARFEREDDELSWKARKTRGGRDVMRHKNRDEGSGDGEDQGRKRRARASRLASSLYTKRSGRCPCG